MVYAPGVGEVAISISSDPDDEDLEHTIRIVGRTTQVIEAMEPGDVLGLRGPYGRGWPLAEARGRDVLIVTGGLGCAPVSGAIDYVFRRRASYGHVTVLHGVKKSADLVHRARFLDWRRAAGHHGAADGRPARPRLARSQRRRDGALRGGRVRAGRTVVLMCGPEVMMRYAIRILRARGISDDDLYLSLERNMKCAVGWCGHCQLGPEFVCKDGPIFPVRRLGRFFEVHGL